MIRTLMRGTALALALPLFAASADAQIAVSANDNKIALVNGQNTVPVNPADRLHQDEWQRFGMRTSMQ